MFRATAASSPSRERRLIARLLTVFLRCAFGLAACAPAPIAPPRVATDALFRVTVDGAAALSSVSGGFVHETPAYTLRYYLGSLPEGVAPASVKLELHNTGEAEVRILWEESRFTYPSGTVSRVIHSGVPYAERARALPPTTVLPGAQHTDRAVPSRSVDLESSGYRVTPLYSPSYQRRSTFGLELALDVGGTPQTLRLRWQGLGGAVR